MEKPLMSANEAARIIGCTGQMVRERIKRGIWTFGEVVPASKTGNKQDSYLINRKKLMKYLCLEERGE